jgi:hypothetical protein
MAMKTRVRALLLKIETTAGVENVPAGTDAIKIESLNISPVVGQITTNENTGSLDGSAPIPAGTYVKISGAIAMKGSGSPGVAPEWGKLAKIAALAETLQAAAVPAGAPEVLAAGTTTQATLGATAVGTLQLYRYMPINFSANPPNSKSFIWDYSAAKVAKLTDTFGSALGVTTSYQIPGNVVYSPATLSIPTATAHVYLDGKRWRVVGCRAAKFGLQLDAGGIMRSSFELWGVLAATAQDDTAIPTLTFDAVTTKPVWRNQSNMDGAFTLNQVAAAVKTFSVDFGLALALPEDPNAIEGFQPPEIISRSVTGRVDPLATLTATRDLFASVRGGSVVPVHARLGTVAGNRLAITIPQAQLTDFNQGDRGGLMTDEVALFATGNDGAVAGLTVY